MPLEPQNGRDDLSAARLWLDKAADGLPPEVYDSSNYEHVLIAAMLGEGYSSLAHYERWDRWRQEDLARVAERDEESAARDAERDRREDVAFAALQEWRSLHRFAEDLLPRDWRAVHIPPGTPYPDEPSETQPPGWFVFGGFSDDPEEGAALILQVEQALDRDDTGMSLERLAKGAAARLNGGQS